VVSQGETVFDMCLPIQPATNEEAQPPGGLGFDIKAAGEAAPS